MYINDKDQKTLILFALNYYHTIKYKTFTIRNLYNL